MFVGWIRKDSFRKDLDELEKTLVLDKNLLLNTAFYNEQLCYGAYDGKSLEGVISAYKFDDSVSINNFYYTNNVDEDAKLRLLKILLENLDEEEKSITVMVRSDEKAIFQKSGFSSFGKFQQVLYNSGGAVFNFTNAMSKSINNENYVPTIKQIDKECFKEDRVDYITKSIFKTSSLILSNEGGFQHSYALNKNLIKLSPWIMKDLAYDDAEKMIRGVIYHRGLKKILAFIPSEVEEITNLYRSYNFEFLEEFELMYKNQKPKMNLDMVYGF